MQIRNQWIQTGIQWMKRGHQRGQSGGQWMQT